MSMAKDDEAELKEASPPYEEWEDTVNRLYADFRSSSQEALETRRAKDVHRARVNARKLITLLKVLDKEKESGLLQPFQKAQKQLGKVRDVDVLIEAFRERRRSAKAAGQKKKAKLLKGFIKLQKKRRAKYRTKLAERLPDVLNEHLDEQWHAFTGERLRRLVAEADLNREVKALEDRFELLRLKFEQTRIPDVSLAAEALASLHRVRITAKELRYLASAAGFALDERYGAYEEHFKQVQDELGRINDLRIWLDMLPGLGADQAHAAKKTLRNVRQQMEKEMERKIGSISFSKLY
jgi:CHAD domain-containing protein